MNYTPVTHVIFDMDGLLINTEELYTLVTQEVLDDFDAKFTFDIKAKMMGMKPVAAAKLLLDELDLSERITPEEFHNRMKPLFPKYFPHAKLMPGVSKLIAHLIKHNIPIAISTGSSNEAFEQKATNLSDFFDKFDFIVKCGSDPAVKRGKPAPDAYEVARTRFTEPLPPPAECLAFEDAPNGVESALAAGMQCVMVPDSQLNRHLTTKATLVLDSLANFKPELFGLPAY